MKMMLLKQNRWRLHPLQLGLTASRYASSCGIHEDPSSTDWPTCFTLPQVLCPLAQIYNFMIRFHFWQVDSSQIACCWGWWLAFGCCLPSNRWVCCVKSPLRPEVHLPSSVQLMHPFPIVLNKACLTRTTRHSSCPPQGRAQVELLHDVLVCKKVVELLILLNVLQPLCCGSKGFRIVGINLGFPLSRY